MLSLRNVRICCEIIEGFKSERFLLSAISNLQPELGLNAKLVAPATNLSEVKKMSYTKAKKTSTDVVSDNGSRLLIT